jgi:chromosome segregation ATPase
MLFMGLVLAVVFQEHVFLYGTLAVGGFLLTRLFTAFFNFRSAYSYLSNNLLIYIEREVGQFYSADTGGAVMRLKNELSDAIARQTAGLQEVIGRLSHTLADAVDKKLTNMNDALTKSMDEWDKAIAAASSVQTEINDAAGRMKEAVEQLSAASESLTREITGNNESVAGQLTVLTNATASFAAEQEAFLSQAKLIERNQQILESTYQSYELTLQNLTQQLGDGLGAYLKMHAQSASQAVNDAMSANIEKIAQLIAIGTKQ